MSGIIYAIINIASDKYYIGQTIHKTKRLYEHRNYLAKGKHGNEHLQSAYDLYGKANFIYIIIENLINVTADELSAREDYWIKFYRSAEREFGYNKAPAGGSSLGVKHTDATKKKWSEQRKGQKRSPEFAASVSERMKGKVVSQETREKQRQAQLGSKKSDATKAKHSERMKGNQFAAGQVHTPERIEARVKDRRGVPISDEHKAKISATQKGRTFTPEHRLELSKAARRRVIQNSKDRA